MDDLNEWDAGDDPGPIAQRESTLRGQLVEGTVTDTRKTFDKFSASRNAPDGEPFTGTYGEWLYLPSQPDGCHWCRLRFVLGQVRYTVMDDCTHRWGIASVCAACFESENITECSSHPRLKRHYDRCKGCGEPIFTPYGPRWEVCSYRCYQREYRKRRRGRPHSS
jgi:hypothetical protein